MKVQPSRRVVLMLAGLALATLPFGSWMAQAHTQTYQSNLSIHARGENIDGHVGTASFCQEGRRIEVLREEAGPDPVVGTAVSGHAGMWGPVPVPGPGTYYATVDQEHRSGYGHDHTCLAGVSHSAEVG